MSFLMASEHAGDMGGSLGIRDIDGDQFKLFVGDSVLQRFILPRGLMTPTALSGPHTWH